MLLDMKTQVYEWDTHSKVCLYTYIKLWWTIHMTLYDINTKNEGCFMSCPVAKSPGGRGGEQVQAVDLIVQRKYFVLAGKSIWNWYQVTFKHHSETCELTSIHSSWKSSDSCSWFAQRIISSHTRVPHCSWEKTHSILFVLLFLISPWRIFVEQHHKHKHQLASQLRVNLNLMV